MKFRIPFRPDCHLISNYWTRLNKTIDLRDTDKSRYFAITEFNNCFIIRSLSLFFNRYSRRGGGGGGWEETKFIAQNVTLA